MPFVCIGSCAITYEESIGGPVTTEHEYFAKALELRDQCDVLVSCILPANVPCCSMALHKCHVELNCTDNSVSWSQPSYCTAV